MSTVIFSFIFFNIGMLFGWYFFKPSKSANEDASKSSITESCVEKINHEIGLQNKQLKELYEDYKGKIDFFKWIFIRYFIVEYERSLLNSGNTMIYTSDAIADIVTYAKKALETAMRMIFSKYQDYLAEQNRKK